MTQFDKPFRFCKTLNGHFTVVLFAVLTAANNIAAAIQCKRNYPVIEAKYTKAKSTAIEEVRN